MGFVILDGIDIRTVTSVYADAPEVCDKSNDLISRNRITALCKANLYIAHTGNNHTKIGLLLRFLFFF